MKKGFLSVQALASALLIQASSVAQTTVFSDDVSTHLDTIYTSSGTIGTSAWLVTRSGGDWGARRNPATEFLELTNDAGASANASGWIFAGMANTSFAPPYNAVLSANTSMVTWSFNLRQPRANPAGFIPNQYGVAVVLAGTAGITNNSGSGYAVVLGQFGSVDPVRLARFGNGIQGGMTNIIISNTAGLNDFGNEYISVKVTYKPATHAWELFLRKDGATGFTQPLSGTLQSQGAAADNTYTGLPLPVTGCWWQGSTAASQKIFFDNFSVSIADPFVTYYYDGSGDLHDVTNWGTNTDGSGIHPSGFTANNQLFEIRNTGSVATTGAWTVSGNDSRINIGNAAAAPVTFTISSGNPVTGIIEIRNASSGSNTLSLQDTAIPHFGVLHPGSNVIYEGNTAQTVRSGIYGNLVITNSAAPKYLGNNIIIQPGGGSLTLAGGVTLHAGTNQVIAGGSGVHMNLSGILRTANTSGFSGNESSTISINDTPTVICTGCTIEYNATGNQTVTPINYANLSLAGNGIKSMGGNGNITVTGTLHLGGSILSIGNHHITAGNISGGSATSYIRTGGTGTLSRTVSNTNTLFPVGNSTYNPVILNNTGIQDDFSVRVSDGSLTGGTTGTQLANHVVQRTWHISEGTPGGSPVTMTLQWNAAEEINDFDRNTAFIAHYTGTAWENYGDHAGLGTTTGTNPYTVTKTGISSFSPFTVGSDGASPLDIHLAAISARNKGRTNEIIWTTGQEDEAGIMELERSRNGIDFEPLEAIPCKGSNNHYTYEDQVPFAGMNYYRLKTKGSDETIAYSRVVSARTPDSRLLIWPNPVTDALTAVTDFEADATVTDMNGKHILSARIKKGINLIDVGSLNPGFYFLRIDGPGTAHVHCLLKH